MIRKYYPFYIIILSLFLGISGPALFSDGMFSDGLLYATISKNLANNLGSIWDLHLTNTLFPHFNEHPPLVFFLQSLFFRLFGESILIERFYSLITFLITGWIITRIWKAVTDTIFHSLAWLPLLFWISVPGITWAASNNILENTMMIFTSLSFLFIIKSLESNRFIYLSLSGLMIFFGLLSKGLVALFPLSLPFWIFIFKRDLDYKRFLADTIVLFMTVIVSLLFLFIISPGSYDSLATYFNHQVVGSIKNVKTVDSRFHILWNLVSELIPSGILVLIVFALSRNYERSGVLSKWAFVFLALALSGVIPIMVSMKQSSFYILATYPAFSLAISVFIAPRVFYLTSRINMHCKEYKIFKFISYILLIIGILINFMFVGKIERDKELIRDVYSIIDFVPENSNISIQPGLWDNWPLHGYFARYANISLDSKIPASQPYFLVKKGFYDDSLTGYKRVTVDLELFDLYRK